MDLYNHPILLLRKNKIDNSCIWDIFSCFFMTLKWHLSGCYIYDNNNRKSSVHRKAAPVRTAWPGGKDGKKKFTEVLNRGTFGITSCS